MPQSKKLNCLLNLYLILMFVNLSIQSQTTCGPPPGDTEYDDECENSIAINITTTTVAPIKTSDNFFYEKIKETLISKNYTNYKRFVNNPDLVNCIVDDLETKDAIKGVNETFYEFLKNDLNETTQVLVRNVTGLMEQLEIGIQDANFECQGFNTGRTVFLIFLLLLSIVCVGLCINSRRTKKDKWNDQDYEEAAQPENEENVRIQLE